MTCAPSSSTLARWSLIGALLSIACSSEPAADDDASDETSAAESESTGTSESSSSATTTSSSASGNEAGSEGGSSSSDTGTDTGTETGEPCEPMPTTEVMDCPMIIGEGFCAQSAKHVPTDTMIEWSHNPPHSGDHFPIWSTKGEHLDPVERGYWVHNLEHGWVVLVYNCPDTCDAELDVVRAVLAARPDLSILLTPDPLLDAPRFAAITWTWVYEFDTPVLEDLLCFVDQHYDHAPESIP